MRKRNQIGQTTTELNMQMETYFVWSEALHRSFWSSQEREGVFFCKVSSSIGTLGAHGHDQIPTFHEISHFSDLRIFVDSMS